jgi:hypothetical protein
MLFHRACTRALDQFGPAELAGVFVDEYPEFDPADMAAANAVARGEDPDTIVDVTPVSAPALAPVAEPVVDVNADMVFDAEAMASVLRTAAQNAGKNEAALVKHARTQGHNEVTSFDTLAGNITAANDVLDWLEQL